jgi:hypothetical protein
MGLGASVTHPKPYTSRETGVLQGANTSTNAQERARWRMALRKQAYVRPQPTRSSLVLSGRLHIDG